MLIFVENAAFDKLKKYLLYNYSEKKYFIHFHIYEQDMTVTGCCYGKSPKRHCLFSMFWRPF
jgi:hypothetical protein